MKLFALAIVVAMVVLPPFASGHVDPYSQSRALQAGPYLVFFEPRPIPPFANSTVSMVAQVSDKATGTLIPKIAARVLVVSGDFSARKTMDPDGTGYLVASMVLPDRGNYSARIFVTDPDTNQEYAADTEFEVFPDVPYRIRPLDQAVDTFVGQQTNLAFEVTDPNTLDPTSLGDLTIRFEHWTDDHKTFISASEEQGTQVSPGTFKVTHKFTEPGMYHARFASNAGGFTYADIPMLHIYATAPQAADKKAPGPELGLGLFLLGAVAVVLRRR